MRAIGFAIALLVCGVVARTAAAATAKGQIISSSRPKVTIKVQRDKKSETLFLSSSNGYPVTHTPHGSDKGHLVPQAYTYRPIRLLGLPVEIRRAEKDAGIDFLIPGLEIAGSIVHDYHTVPNQHGSNDFLRADYFELGRRVWLPMGTKNARTAAINASRLLAQADGKKVYLELTADQMFDAKELPAEKAWPLGAKWLRYSLLRHVRRDEKINLGFKYKYWWTTWRVTITGTWTQMAGTR